MRFILNLFFLKELDSKFLLSTILDRKGNQPESIGRDVKF